MPVTPNWMYNLRGSARSKSVKLRDGPHPQRDQTAIVENQEQKILAHRTPKPLTKLKHKHAFTGQTVVVWGRGLQNASLSSGSYMIEQQPLGYTLKFHPPFGVSRRRPWIVSCGIPKIKMIKPLQNN
jgi:hypothetical protein